MARSLTTGLFGLAVAGLISAASAAEVPSWLTCPDEERVDIRQDRSRDAVRVRAVAPKAGARTSEELAAFAKLQKLSYDLYDVFDAGGDLHTAFAPTKLKLVGFVYGDPGPETERLNRDRRRDTRTFFGFVADDPANGQRLVIIRGTLQPNEWVRNLQARQTPYGGPGSSAQVHEGFYTIFKSMEVEMAGQVTSLSEALPDLVRGRRTVFVGHSLGGALATLAGVEASHLTPGDASRIRVVTIASPRVGDAGFVQRAAMTGRIDRVCNMPDVVTAVPPSAGRISYAHVGKLFAVSSFDWPQINNDLKAPGDQILCWHSIYSYIYMLSPKKDPADLGTCSKTLQK